MAATDLVQAGHDFLEFGEGPESRDCHWLGNVVDLLVSVEGPADDAYLDSLARGMIDANRILFDGTIGERRGSLRRAEAPGSRFAGQMDQGSSDSALILS